MFPTVRAQTKEADVKTGDVAKVPLDPDASAWKSGKALDVDLIPQRMSKPFGGGTVPGVQVRALTDGKRFGVRLEWQVAKSSPTVGIRSHRDSCAVMFPAFDGPIPSYMMGGPGQPVVVWQWKPDWEDAEAQEAYRLARFPQYADFYDPNNDGLWAEKGDRPRSGKANVLVAEGFGTLTRTEDPDLEVESSFKDGRWRVVFRHPQPGRYPDLGKGRVVPMNFAVWDGGNGDAGCKKNYSALWPAVGITSGERSVPGLTWPGTFAAGTLAAAIAWAIRRRQTVAEYMSEGSKE